MRIRGYGFFFGCSHTGDQPQEEISQIWLQVREQSRKKFKNLCYILVTCYRAHCLNMAISKNKSSKFGDLKLLFSTEIFLYELQWVFFLGHQVKKISSNF